MLETKVMHEKRRLWTNGGSEHESFSNVALSNIQEGGWKDPDIKTRTSLRQSNWESMKDCLW